MPTSPTCGRLGRRGDRGRELAYLERRGDPGASSPISGGAASGGSAMP
ncbi:MAG TPA: hypothetical protein VIX73_00275 [Kofleriaceae bacterium]